MNIVREKILYYVEKGWIIEWTNVFIEFIYQGKCWFKYSFNDDSICVMKPGYINVELLTDITCMTLYFKRNQQDEK